ncbi:hypothetical protein JCM14036_00030 [Desulfotomaculum defluvii]
MGHIRAVTFKLLFNGLPLFLILVFVGNVNWLTSITLSLLIGLIAYALGDVFVLPAAGNLMATLADGALVFFMLYLLRNFGIDLSMTTILLSTVAVLLVEGLIYHPYLKRLVSFNSLGPRLGKGK